MQAPNFASGKNRINSELRKYFNTYQPKNKAVANYNLTHFGNLDKAIYNYMVLVRRQAQTASISKQIANAANFNALNKIEASGNLSQEIKTQIQAKRLELFGKYLNKNLKNVTNLNAYEANLRKRYNASTMGTYRNGFNKRLGNIENARRNRILAKANPLPNANVNYLRNRILAGKNSNRPAVKFRVKNALMERANLSENNKRFLMKHFGNNQNVIAKLAGKNSEGIPPSANITSPPEAAAPPRTQSRLPLRTRGMDRSSGATQKSQPPEGFIKATMNNILATNLSNNTQYRRLQNRTKLYSIPNMIPQQLESKRIRNLYQLYGNRTKQNIGTMTKNKLETFKTNLQSIYNKIPDKPASFMSSHNNYIRRINKKLSNL